MIDVFCIYGMLRKELYFNIIRCQYLLHHWIGCISGTGGGGGDVCVIYRLDERGTRHRYGLVTTNGEQIFRHLLDIDELTNTYDLKTNSMGRNKLTVNRTHYCVGIHINDLSILTGM